MREWNPLLTWTKPTIRKGYQEKSDPHDVLGVQPETPGVEVRHLYHKAIELSQSLLLSIQILVHLV